MTDVHELLADWRRVPDEIEELIRGIPDDDLRSRPGSEGMTLKELVHHLTEANIVAASIIIAALGASGCTFDWSWLWPNRDWTDRLGYNDVPVDTAIPVLRALIEHLSDILSRDEAMLAREVMLLDSPGADTYRKTVAELIQMEVGHAVQHLGDARAALG